MEASDGPFADLASKLLSRAAGMMSGGRVPALARMVIGESWDFPDLARIWLDESSLDSSALSLGSSPAPRRVARRPPATRAFSLMGPMVMAVLFREVFGGVGVDPPDSQALTGQYAHTSLRGLSPPPTGENAADERRTK